MSINATTLSTLKASPRRKTTQQSYVSPAVLDTRRPDLSEGACVQPVNAGVDFYADEDSPEIERALLVCDRCPVIDLCLEYALVTREFHGVWGGMTGHDRSKLVRRLRRRAA